MRNTLPSNDRLHYKRNYNSSVGKMQFDPSKKPQYILKFPFRFVRPYKHCYETFAKKRWLNKPLLPTLAKQFLAYSQQYFKQAIRVGKITINGKPVGQDYLIRNSDMLRHETVREEPPILDLPVEIIHDDEEFLVVNKPPGMIVHTGGGYHYNTLMAILYYEMGYKNLYILHRLDRLTSGLVILAKKKEKTTKFHEQSTEQIMKKCYFARVSGNPAFAETTLKVPMICLSHKEGVWSVYDPQTMAQLAKTNQPKESETKFTKLWYDQKTDSSLLECRPITGRTHQIRVHLQHLGHSILNDVVYGGRFVGNWIIGKIQDLKSEAERNKVVVDVVEKRIKGAENLDKQQEEQQYEDSSWYEKWDYKTKALEIMLHSFEYKFEGNIYKSNKPYWTEPEAVKHVQGLAEQIQKNNQQQDLVKKEQKRVSTYESSFLKEVDSIEKVQPKVEKIPVIRQEEAQKVQEVQQK